MTKERENAMIGTLEQLCRSIELLAEKVDSCQGMCESVLDEVVPIGAALASLAVIPWTAD